MTRKLIIAAVAVALLLMELFYFRFHTYLQRTEVMEMMPVGVRARVLAQGTFREVDFVHKGSGTARILEDGNQRYLRLEGFEVTNGPDLYVYLAEGAAPTRDLDSLGGYTNLGRLKGNVGDQNYPIPPGTPDSQRTAVIWCREFGVLFSFAVMSAPQPGGVVCTADARQCPDGTWVGRTGPRCEFVCP